MAMFGSNANKAEGPAKNGQGARSSINHFGDGTVIQGDIKSQGDIRIEGKIIGTVESASKIAVGPSGIIMGDIVCQNADIEGKIEGRMEVKELLNVKGTAIIEGDIVVNKLVVEAGAKFNGTCNMGARPAVKKQYEQGRPSLKKEAV